jgi:hypothetical protein
VKTQRAELTPEQEAIVAAVERAKGKTWADDHIDLILEEARLVGELVDDT